MKTTKILLLALCTLAVSALKAQRPLVEEGKKWIVEERNCDVYYHPELPSTYTLYVIHGDTVVDGKQWKKLYWKRYYDTWEKPDYDFPTFLTQNPTVKPIREENGEVYIMSGENPEWETKIYNFNVDEGDDVSVSFYHWMNWGDEPNPDIHMIVDSISTVINNGKEYRVIFMTTLWENVVVSSYDVIWLEGIGDLGGPLAMTDRVGAIDCMYVIALIECSLGDEKLYEYDLRADIYNGISSVTTPDAPSVSVDLQGRQLPRVPQRGVFIENGRKKVK